jgi:DNA-binding SARP family transcriptional activator
VPPDKSDDQIPCQPRDGHRAVRDDGHTIRIYLLNGFQLEYDGRALVVPHSIRRLLAFLGIGGRSSRAEIAGTLWPDVPETRAQASLRTALWRLRRFTDRPLVSGGDALDLDVAVEVDLGRLVATARGILADTGRSVATPAVHALAAPGELLSGWYDNWVLNERERLRQIRLHALEVAAERLTGEQRYAEAVEAALAAVRLDPLRESATRTLIAVHLAENNVVEAVRRFESLRECLANELGVEPTPDLEQLVMSGLSGSSWASQDVYTAVGRSPVFSLVPRR